MIELGDLKGCKMTVFKEWGDEKIADAVIIEHDKTKQLLMVDGRGFPSPDALRATVFIETGPRTIKSQATVRRQNENGRREISLYKAQVIRESRISTRYSLSTPAKVEKIMAEGELKLLEQPLEVTVLNISTSGIQMETAAPELEVDTQFQLVLDIAGERTVINTSVVRVVSSEGEVRRLGCSFLALEQ